MWKGLETDFLRRPMVPQDESIDLLGFCVRELRESHGELLNRAKQS